MARPLIMLVNLDQTAEDGERSAGEQPPLLPAARDRGRGGWWSPEQPFEERRAGIIGVVAGKVDASRQIAGRTGVARLRMRDDVFHILASAVTEQRQHGGVAAIDILAELQLARLVHKRRLVGDVD